MELLAINYVMAKQSELLVQENLAQNGKLL